MLNALPESLTGALGLVGVAVYLGSYALLQLGMVRGTSYTYSSLNILAATCVPLSLIHAFNVSSLLIQVSWILISVIGMARVFFLTQMVRFTPEESAFVSAKLPDLPKYLARRYLDIGTWQDLQPGDLLTEYGKPVERLSYIAEGGADVLIGGELVGQSVPGTIIGELTALTTDAASATVRINQPSRAFIVSTERLKRFLKTNAEVNFALRSTFVIAAREKLLKRNDDYRALEHIHRPPAAIEVKDNT